MPSPEPFLVFTRALQGLGLRYMISGSVAAIFYGEPRMTNDVDIVLHLRGEDAVRLAEAFPPAEFYCPPVSVIRLELTREQRGHFNLIHHASGFKADLYLSGRDPLHAWALARVVEADFGGEKVAFAPAEYVIVRKLEFYREGQSPKHLRDIARMLSSLGDEWNRDTLLEMIRQQRLQAEWQKALSTAD